MDKPFTYNVVKETKEGVLLEISNGDSIYLTKNEFKTFKKNRKNKGFE